MTPITNYILKTRVSSLKNVLLRSSVPRIKIGSLLHEKIVG
jgi:hypothetical protein